MKKRTKIAISLLVLFILYIFIQFESIEPAPTVIGCYTSDFEGLNDHVCLYKTGKFEQFHSVKEKEKYNTSTWDSFSYSNDEGEFIAVTLKDFIMIKSNKDGEIVEDMDIQPRKNSFNKTIFRIGKHRVYFLDE